MIAQASGILTHGFYGDYVATIVLDFGGADAAKAALVKLGEPWKLGRKSDRVLVASAKRDALDAIKAKFASPGFELTIKPCGLDHCRRQCADASIDGLPHSIDVGPAFSLAVECDDPRQVALFGEDS